MVFSVDSETVTPPKLMATGKPKPLHNFSLPDLKWGNPRFLRCMKVDPRGPISSTSLDRRCPPSDAESVELSSPNRSGSFRKPSTPTLLEKLKKPSTAVGSSDSGIEEIRAKLLDHLRTTKDQMRYKVPEEREEEKSSAAAPWNLRTRRAACKAPVEIGGVGGGSPPPHAAENSTRLRLRGSAAAAAAAQMGEKKEKEKFSISLSRQEIEGDFLAMIGSKPSRRPKKRARIIQRQLDSVFPGLWLSEITADTYKVPDFPESGKNRMDWGGCSASNQFCCIPADLRCNRS